MESCAKEKMYLDYVSRLYLKYAGVYFMIALEDEISCIKVNDAY